MKDDDNDDDFQFYRKFVDISNSLQSKGQAGRQHSALSLRLPLPAPLNGNNFISWLQKKPIPR